MARTAYAAFYGDGGGSPHLPPASDDEDGDPFSDEHLAMGRSAKVQRTSGALGDGSDHGGLV